MGRQDHDGEFDCTAERRRGRPVSRVVRTRAKRATACDDPLCPQRHGHRTYGTAIHEHHNGALHNFDDGHGPDNDPTRDRDRSAHD